MYGAQSAGNTELHLIDVKNWIFSNRHNFTRFGISTGNIDTDVMIHKLISERNLYITGFLERYEDGGLANERMYLETVSRFNSMIRKLIGF